VGNASAQLAEDIVVTGTRIKQENVLVSGPVVTLTHEDIATRGVTRVEDLVNQLPQIFAGQGSSISNGASGIATVDLRGLGSARTLVLVDGRRMASGTVNEIAPDLNQIPTALIKNIDVLTGGSGAVYGSDALAGVVNFQMERDFEGFRFDAQIGSYQHNNRDKRTQAALADAGELTPRLTQSQFDGFSKDFTFVFGKNIGRNRGNITSYLGYRETDSVLQNKRDYSGCPLADGRNSDGQISCGGSSTSGLGLFADGAFDLDNFLFTIDPVAGDAFQRVSATGSSSFPPPSIFNTNSDTLLQRPDKRYTGGVFAHYDFSSRDTIYLDLMYTKDKSIGQVSVSANFFNTDRISCDNPFLSAQQRDIICTSRGFGPNDDADLRISRRNVEGRPRREFLTHTSWRINGGARGQFRLLEGFDYDVSAQYSTTGLDETYRNDLSKINLQRALLATTDANGNPVCDSVLDGTDPNCVPINYFKVGEVTQAALDYITLNAAQQGRYSQTIGLASISGGLGIHAPGTQDEVKIVLGGEYRADDYTLAASPEFASGDLSGQIFPIPNQSGNFNSWEAFGEIQIPLFRDRSFAKDANVSGAFRLADNSLSGGTTSYSARASWQINTYLGVRAQYQRAARVANALELFTPSRLDRIGGLIDPCQGATPTASQAQCANSGVTAAQYGNIPLNPERTLNVIRGGNEGLNPENSDTFTLGAVFQFSQGLAGLSVSLDYFDISVQDFIGRAAPSRTLDGCIVQNDPFLCGLIRRDPVTGALWTNSAAFITDTNINTGKLLTSGLDVSANYQGDIAQGWGGVNIQFNGTYLTDLSIQALPGDPVLKCAGRYGGRCGTPNPRWRHVAALTWLSDKEFDARVSWRHFARVKAEAALNAQPGSFDEYLEAVDYFDMSVAYRGIADTTLRFGVNNVFDKAPPLSTSTAIPFGNGNTYSQVYDALGRFMFARLTFDY
jgi:outer membrane receptor protein involved in Fe transport